MRIIFEDFDVNKGSDEFVLIRTQCINYLIDVLMNSYGISKNEAFKKAVEILSKRGEIFQQESDMDKLELAHALSDLGAVITVIN